MLMLKTIVNERTGIVERICNVSEEEAKAIASRVTVCYPLLSESRFVQMCHNLSRDYEGFSTLLSSDRVVDVQNAVRLLTLDRASCCM